ncbi:MAG: UDP-N-acetylmuramoyl-L-alanine--D-glutamate ligase, partial [Bacteroidota bacterium]|nr:UDP-N-acetylmuramoyl-L-alanine--D-glutamate ligase [Bacteroidota bacterium]
MNKRIVILGAGESGVGSAVLAKKLASDVFVSDFGSIKDKYKQKLKDYNISWEEGKHSEDKILNASEIVKSPGIPDNTDIIVKAKKKNISVISEIEFAGRHTKALKICITGSNGKTTTTKLIYHILSMAGLNVGMAGNVGSSFALQVAQENYDYYVIELSSFQLDGMYNFKADIAIIMNITPDHLDRYNGMQDYINSKYRIIQNQDKTDYFIYWADDEILKKENNKRELCSKQLTFSLNKEIELGAYVSENVIKFKNIYKDFDMSVNQLALKGQHNTYNSMAAGIVAQVLQIRKETIRESLSSFKGVEHRLEPVLKVHDIEFVN